jgi:hypothetical protein
VSSAQYGCFLYFIDFVLSWKAAQAFIIIIIIIILFFQFILSAYRFAFRSFTIFPLVAEHTFNKIAIVVTTTTTTTTTTVAVL